MLILSGDGVRLGIVPTGNLGSRRDADKCGGEGGGVQGLADVANIFRAAIVLVKEAATRCEEQEGKAQKGRGRAPGEETGRRWEWPVHW
jgi:hypothetical protein